MHTLVSRKALELYARMQVKMTFSLQFWLAKNVSQDLKEPITKRDNLKLDQSFPCVSESHFAWLPFGGITSWC